MVVFQDVDPENLPEAVGPTDKQRTLSAADRNRQRGSAACAKMIESLIHGPNFRDSSAVCVVEWHAGVAADWLRAVRQIQNQKTVGQPSVESHVWGLSFSDEEHEALFLNHKLRSECYDSWYNGTITLPGAGAVGPKELPDNELPALEPKPEPE